MPLNANFLADFSSFLGETAKSITATKEFQTAAAAVGPAVDQSLAQAGKAAEGAGGHASKAMADALELGKQIGKSLKTVASDITGFVSGYINEFAEAEQATARLETALKNAGQTAPGVAKQYGEIAKEIQNISAFSSGAITNAQIILTTLGGIKPDNIRDTLIAVTELARGMAGQGMTLESAAILVAKAAASDGESLGKLKTILGEAYKPGMDFAQIMEAIMTKFSGQNAAYIATTAGHIESLKNSMSDINEKIGQVFAENLKTIFDWFQQLPEGIQTFSIAIVGFGTALAPVLVSVSSLIKILQGLGLASLWGAISAGFTVVIDAIVAFLSFIGPVGWLILGVGALVAALWVYWDEIKAGFKWIWEQITAITTDIVTAVSKLYYGIKYWLQDKLAEVFEFAATQGPQSIVDGFKRAAQLIVGFSIVPDMVDAIGREFGRLDRVMVDPAWAAADEATAAFAGIGDAALPTLAAGAGRAGGPTTITVNMSGMLGTDDPQTRSLVSDLVSNAVMQGMRGGRLLGTA